MLTLFIALVVAQPTCAFSETLSGSVQALTLLTPSGVPFAHVVSGHVELNARVDGAFDVTGDLSAVHFRATGILGRVHATTQTGLATGFTSGERTALRLERLEGGEAVVRLEDRRDVEFIQPPREIHIPCRELRLSSPYTPAVHRAWHSDGGDILDVGTRVFEAPKLRPILSLRDFQFFKTLERRGEWLRVLLRFDDGASAEGWVRRPHTENTFFGGVVGSTTSCTVNPPPPPRDCANTLRLLARVADVQPLLLGTIESGAAFDVVSRDLEWVTVNLRSSPLDLFTGWAFVVSAEELERCSALASDIQ